MPLSPCSARDTFPSHASPSAMSSLTRTRFLAISAARAVAMALLQRFSSRALSSPSRLRILCSGFGLVLCVCVRACVG